MKNKTKKQPLKANNNNPLFIPIFGQSHKKTNITCFSQPKLGPFSFSVPVVNRLVRTFNGYADVVRLVLGELGESSAELAQVKCSYLLI